MGRPSTRCLTCQRKTVRNFCKIDMSEARLTKIVIQSSDSSTFSNSSQKCFFTINKIPIHLEWIKINPFPRKFLVILTGEWINVFRFQHWVACVTLTAWVSSWSFAFFLTRCCTLFCSWADLLLKSNNFLLFLLIFHKSSFEIRRKQ